MPGKARRVASRQAQIGRRKKRQHNAPSDIQLPVSGPTEVDGNERSANILPPVLEPPEAPPVPAPVRTRQVRPTPVAGRNVAATAEPVRGLSRARRDRPATYNFIGTEVRRILLLSGVVLAIIIALGIVL